MTPGVTVALVGTVGLGTVGTDPTITGARHITVIMDGIAGMPAGATGVAAAGPAEAGAVVLTTPIRAIIPSTGPDGPAQSGLQTGLPFADPVAKRRRGQQLISATRED